MSDNLNMHMDHAVVWVDDIEGTSKFLRDIVGFRQHPMEIGVSGDDPTTGGMEGVFFDGNGIWLELIKPTTPGPGMDILKKLDRAHWLTKQAFNALPTARSAPESTRRTHCPRPDSGRDP
jgi:catechol 2,3-dioxygenase-like lactoylglutathione lyase family enzyme